MSVIIFLYNNVVVPIFDSGILNAASISDFILRVSDLTKKTPPDFQIFTQTLFHYGVMYINNDSAVGYDDFKIIIRDYIEISYNRHTQASGSPVYDSEFTKITQIRPLSCILSRLLCDYLCNIKINGNRVSTVDNEFD